MAVPATTNQLPPTQQTTPSTTQTTYARKAKQTNKQTPAHLLAYIQSSDRYLFNGLYNTRKHLRQRVGVKNQPGHVQPGLPPQRQGVGSPLHVLAWEVITLLH